MSTDPFKEDFFERVIDVKWETEPEVYWLIGTGNPFFVNGINYGDGHAWVYRSSDGKRWTGTDLWKTNTQGVGQIFGGSWMRKGLEKGAEPTWVMVGGTNRFQPSSCAISSIDGETVPLDRRVVFDMRHFCNNVARYSTNQVYTNSIDSFLQSHTDFFFSTDGRTWTPPNYHGGETPSGAPAQLAARATTNTKFYPMTGPTNIVSALTSIPQDEAQPLQATPFAEASLRAEVSPFASTPGRSLKADEIIFKASGISTTGRVRKGPHRGKQLRIDIVPYIYPQGGGAHGNNTVWVYDIQTGQRLAVVNTGIARTIHIGYGHYTFVIGGSSGGNKSTIAYSEDAVRWRKVELGVHSQVNAIVVGPRPRGSTPRPPGPIEPPPPVVIP